jgi:hypothetical protein
VLDSAEWDYMGGSLCVRSGLAGKRPGRSQDVPDDMTISAADFAALPASHVPRVEAPVSEPPVNTVAILGLSRVTSLLRLPRVADYYYSGSRFGGHGIIMSTRKPGGDAESASRDGIGSDGEHGRVNYSYRCARRHRSEPRHGLGCGA